MADEYDVIVIGTGAGGGTVAHALAPTGARILLVERGNFVPQEPENWDPAAVWRRLRYRTTERWVDEAGRLFRPYMHYCVGGNTKFWGSVLYRLRKEDFEEVEHVDGVSPAWPIDYQTLEPYYERAEQLYEVHGQHGIDPTEPERGPYPYPPIPHSAEIAETIERLQKQGLTPSPLPLGLRDPGTTDGCILCDTCNSFPCQRHAKSEAEVCCVRPTLTYENVTLWTQATAQRLITDPSGRRLEAVEIEREGQIKRVEAAIVIVSCGAANSAALLLRSATEKHPGGVANSSGLVGRRYMAHLSTMMQGFHPFRKNHAVFQKTVAINDFYFRGPDTTYPLGHIQSQGRVQGVVAKAGASTGRTRRRLMAQVFPLWAYEAWCARGQDWLAMTEDLPRLDNRVTVAPDGLIRLSYEPNNLVAHRQLVAEMKRALLHLSFWTVVQHTHREKNTTDQCGTLCFGTDPKTSVLDSYCRSHDVENLFVVDASFFPSSGAVNPGLTIAAQALRVADHIAETELRSMS